MTRLPKDALSQIHLIRVLSMLGIFLHHVWNGLRPGNLDGIAERLLDALFQWGGLGVVFFNILSGFLLALPHLGASRRPLPSCGPFMRHRMLRILPPYYLALLLFCAGNVVLFRTEWSAAVFTFLKHAVFLQSFQYSTFLSNMAAYWYLGLLVQFYLLFPWLLKLFVRFGAAQTCLLICALSWGGCEILARYLESHPDSALGMAGYLVYFNLPARLPEFAVGMWMAGAWQPGRRSPMSIPFDRGFTAFIGGSLLFVLLGMPFAWEMRLPLLGVYKAACCFVVLIALFLLPIAARWGSSSIVTRLAAASYSIYLVHQPLLSYSVLWGIEGQGPFLSLAFMTLAGGPACYVLARWIDKAVEKMV